MSYCTFEYPYHDINNRLYNLLDNWSKAEIPGGALKTPDNLHGHNLQDIDRILIWLRRCLNSAANQLSVGDDQNLLYKLSELKIEQCWGIMYNKGNKVIKHNHFPYALSFVYFVKTPKGSSPLIIEGKRIKAEEGKLVMFHANQVHWCNNSNANGRCCLVGNIRY